VLRVNSPKSWMLITISGMALLLCCRHSTDPGSAGPWSVSHLPAGNLSYYRIMFTDRLHGWVVGDSGMILSTSDGGEVWHLQKSDTRAPLLCGDFVDAERGWVAGGSGTLVSTTNGGVTWTAQHPVTDTTCAILSLSFTDAQRGWAVTNTGGIASTTDGGATWRAQESPITWALTAVQFVNPQKGWAAGIDQTILRTTDGGLHWLLDHLEMSGPFLFTDLAFADEQRGWITTSVAASSRMESGTLLLSSTDGGQAWVPQATLPALDLRSVWFSDPNNGWVVGEDQIFHSTDGGKTWQVSGARAGEFLVSLSFIDPHHGWALSFGGSVLRYEE
jgi:photosystem II stability/assembly factor-like uncharacterized protein